MLLKTDVKNAGAGVEWTKKGSRKSHYCEKEGQSRMFCMYSTPIASERQTTGSGCLER